MTRPYEKKLIQAAKGLRFLVLDELHTYGGRLAPDFVHSSVVRDPQTKKPSEGFMSNEDSFSCTFYLPSNNREEISRDGVEKSLLEKLVQSGGDSEDALWNLSRFYHRQRRWSLAMEYTKQLLEKKLDVEKKALCLLTMGQLLECLDDYNAAIDYYRRAFSMEPADAAVWYFVHNNLGYCLNYFGKHKEAERYCRTAIRVDPYRFNAYKNLGISLEGQGEYTEAAKLYIQATRLQASDSRALRHLEELLLRHSEIFIEIPDMEEQLHSCRCAVQWAQDAQNEIYRHHGEDR